MSGLTRHTGLLGLAATRITRRTGLLRSSILSQLQLQLEASGIQCTVADFASPALPDVRLGLAE